MRSAFVAAVLIVAGGTTDRAGAGWPHHGGAPNPTPGYVPGTMGRQSFAGVPGLGGPIPTSTSRPNLNPVVGGVARSGLFVHPVTGRTRYTGVGYDSTLGRFGTYHFWK